MVQIGGGYGPPVVLLADDDVELRGVIAEALAGWGCEVREVASGEEAVRLAEGVRFDVALLDLVMPGMNGLQALERLRELDPLLPVLIVTGQGGRPQALEAIQRGAYDFLSKPVRLAELKVVVERALERRRLQDELERLRERAEQRVTFENIVGQSGAMQEVFRMVDKVARTDLTVLIEGESGTGKELIAGAIHGRSRRAGGPFVKLSCVAIPDTLLESELFGYEKGAFTGATRRKPGKFEVAHGGTLFLDEIGDMSPETQAKLLRVLEEREFERLGGNEPIRVNVRLIAATNRDLRRLVQEQRFREDLFHRLNVFAIRVPPLRDRRSDIPYLVEAFLAAIRREHGIEGRTLSASAMARLLEYPWPGNVRELKHCLESAALRADSPIIRARDLPPPVGLESAEESAQAAPEIPLFGEGHHLDEMLGYVERYLIERALAESAGVQAQAAVRLGIGERSLWYRVSKYGIDPARFRSPPPGQPGAGERQGL